MTLSFEELHVARSSKCYLKLGQKKFMYVLLVQKLNIQIFMVWICQPKKNYYQAINKKMKFVIFWEQLVLNF